MFGSRLCLRLTRRGSLPFLLKPVLFFLSLRVSWNMHSRVGGSSEEAISITQDPLNLDRVPVEQPGRQCGVVDSHMRF